MQIPFIPQKGAFLIDHLVLILGAKPELESYTSNLVKVVNSNMIMSCKFKSSQTMIFSWLKDGKPVVYTSRIYTSNIGNGMQLLNVNRIKPSDKGTYTCIGANSDGKTSGYMKLDIILSKNNSTKYISLFK